MYIFFRYNQLSTLLLLLPSLFKNPRFGSETKIFHGSPDPYNKSYTDSCKYDPDFQNCLLYQKVNVQFIIQTLMCTMYMYMYKSKELNIYTSIAFIS